MSEVKVNHGQTLSKVPIFSGLTESEFAFLVQRAVSRNFSAGETVFSEGEPCTGLYVVESGHIRIFKSSSGGREEVLSIDGPGSSVAELPVFDGGTYPASVTAIEDATLLFVSKQDFQSLCLAHPEVAAGMASAPRLWPLLAFTIAALSLFWLRTPIESLTGTSPLTAHTSQEWWTAFLASISLSGISVACLTGLMWKGRNLELLLFGTVAGVAFVGVLSPIGTAQREEPRMVRDAARSDVRDSAGDCFHLVLRNGQSLYILRQWTSTPEGEWELVSFRQAG